MKVALQIRDSAREPLVSELEISTIPAGTRAMRAATRWVGLWVLAVGSILVPLLHFVLVPGFFIAGPLLAMLAFRETVVVTSTQVTCPKCGKQSGIETGTTGWPAGLRCTHCSTTFSAKPHEVTG
jgi:hypothetical protein